jgi:predicted glycosyltransferase
VVQLSQLGGLKFMKLWVEYLTPKQLMFYSPVIEEAKRRGWSVLVTTRRYRETDFLAKKLGVKARVIGKYGGGDLYDKLMSGIGRMRKLAPLIERFKPDVALSTSPDAARVAFGLGVPHVLANDSPHSTAVAKLTVPLSSKLVTPWVIPKEEWVRYGIATQDIIQYKALDPVMWLKHLSLREELVIRASKRFKHLVAVRIEEVQASYMMIDKPTMIEDSIAKLTERARDSLVFVLPRYTWQVRYLKERFKGLGNVVVATRPVHGPSLLRKTTLFIGSGGTMTCEAALLGIPALSFYPKEPLHVERFLMEFGLLKRVRSEEIPEVATSILSEIDELRAKQRELSKRLWSSMEDPLSKIMEVIEGLGSRA